MASNSKNIAELLNGDATLTATDIANNAVTSDKILSVAATKLTGTIADARFPSTLPAISGVNLTNLVSTFDALTDTTVSTANPNSTSNATPQGHLWLNKSNGQMYVLKDATNNANVWVLVGGAEYPTATGGTVTTDGDYKIHTFNSSGTFAVGQQGNVDGANTLEYLLVAGGGGGRSGGGGAGGMLTASVGVPAVGNHTITIGAGGTGNSATKGANSVFGTTATAIGGGNGSATGNNGGGSWMDGGSGGGSPRDGIGKTNVGPGSRVVGQGQDGGAAGGSTCASAGGGGGKTQAGFAGEADCGSVRNGQAAEGGDGAASTISGSSVYYAGGGGGGYETSNSTYAAVSGGAGGGGQGWDTHVAGADQSSAGGTNLGGGGGGYNAGGKNGGSGVCIIRYKFQ